MDGGLGDRMGDVVAMWCMWSRQHCCIVAARCLGTRLRNLIIIYPYIRRTGPPAPESLQPTRPAQATSTPLTQSALLQLC